MKIQIQDRIFDIQVFASGYLWKAFENGKFFVSWPVGPIGIQDEIRREIRAGR